MWYIKVLEQLDFVHDKHDRAIFWWGCGSTVWGYIVEITPLNNEWVRVNYRHWYITCEGEQVADDDYTFECEPYKMFAFIGEKLPLWRF